MFREILNVVSFRECGSESLEDGYTLPLRGEQGNPVARSVPERRTFIHPYSERYSEPVAFSVWTHRLAEPSHPFRLNSSAESCTRVVTTVSQIATTLSSLTYAQYFAKLFG